MELRTHPVAIESTWVILFIYASVVLMTLPMSVGFSALATISLIVWHTYFPPKEIRFLRLGNEWLVYGSIPPDQDEATTWGMCITAVDSLNILYKRKFVRKRFVMIIADNIGNKYEASLVGFKKQDTLDAIGYIREKNPSMKCKGTSILAADHPARL